MRQRSLQTCLILAALLSLAGCAGLGLGSVFREPDVDVVGAELTRTGLSGADVLFEFEVDNPNGMALVLDGLNYRLRLNDEPLLNGRQDKRTEIAAKSESRVSLPVSIQYDDILRVLETLDDNERPNYELQADFQFAVPIVGTVTVPVTKRGQLSLDRLLRLGIGR
ncbi:MAG TPA: LEA type 2 family protein [Thermoanaerobaculia bacterium]|nr:LEA type 2 family protein [Thermoanaerobaculia bacterium]